MKTYLPVPVLSLGLMLAAPPSSVGAAAKDFTDSFDVDKGELSSTGRNRFFVLEPGYVLRLEGKDKGKPTVLVITVLNETRLVDGVETRVVEEKESVGGQLVEISRNFFAVSRKTSDVFYFGEEVDIYKDGKVVEHEGAWLSGIKGARFGLALPGRPLLGARYYQELAPQVAMPARHSARHRLPSRSRHPRTLARGRRGTSRALSAGAQLGRGEGSCLASGRAAPKALAKS